MTAEQKRGLDENGYLVLENFMAPEFLEAVQQRVDDLFEKEGEAAGSEFRPEPQTRRLANLADKGNIFVEAIQMPTILECIEHGIGAEYKLSIVNVRSPLPHSTWVQPLHIDGGGLPDEKGYYVCNSVWMLDDFTLENGAIRMIPGSHLWTQRPQDVLADPASTFPGGDWAFRKVAAKRKSPLKSPNVRRGTKGPLEECCSCFTLSLGNAGSADILPARSR